MTKIEFFINDEARSRVEYNSTERAARFMTNVTASYRKTWNYNNVELFIDGIEFSMPTHPIPYRNDWEREAAMLEYKAHLDYCVEMREALFS